MSFEKQRTNQAVVMGSLARDQVETQGRVDERIGGVVWYAGITLARLGVDARVLTRIAAADEILAEALRARGVDVAWQPATRTTNFVNRYDVRLGHRTQFVPSVAEPIETARGIEDLGSADLAYLGALHPADLADDVVPVLNKTKPRIVAIDVQGYTRLIHQGTVVAGLDRRLPELLAVCSVIKASKDEARLVTGLSDPEDAARTLADPGREALVTCGPDGAFVCYQGGCHYEPAVPTQIADPNGAGDIFFAAYLAKRLDDASVGAAASFAADFTSKSLASSDMTHLLHA